MSTKKTLPLPAGDAAEIHTMGGHDYLVVRLEVGRKTDWYLAELQGGRPVVVPQSKRGHLVGLLKENGVYATSKAIVPGKWVLFTPSEQREFRS